MGFYSSFFFSNGIGLHTACRNLDQFFYLSTPRCTDVIRSPKLNAIPWVLERIRMYPASFPSLSSFFSTETLTKASSPKTLQVIAEDKVEPLACCRMYRSTDIKTEVTGQILIVQRLSEMKRGALPAPESHRVLYPSINGHTSSIHTRHPTRNRDKRSTLQNNRNWRRPTS
jgi:hypothetical protein